MTTRLFKPNEGILGIDAYVGGESKAPGSARIIKLSSNENPFGSSPLALEALHDVDGLALQKYPDGHSVALREAIAAKFDLSVDRLICGAGSDEIISLLCKSYLSPGDEVVYATHSFLMYGIFAKGCGATPVEVAEDNLTPDLAAMLAAITPRTKMVFLTNPNNPTGSFNTPADIAKFRDALPENVMLVLDDAYAEYAQASEGYENGFSLAKARNDVVVLRTFSKIYGLAGLRLGYGYAPAEVVDILDRIRGPFNVSVPAQIAGLAALGDDGFIESSVAHNTRWRAYTAKRLTDIGLKVWPSAGNFVLASFATAQQAEGCRLFLKERGILVRQMGAYKLPQSLRVTIGAEDEMILACDAIEAYINSL